MIALIIETLKRDDVSDRKKLDIIVSMSCYPLSASERLMVASCISCYTEGTMTLQDAVTRIVDRLQGVELPSIDSQINWLVNHPSVNAFISLRTTESAISKRHGLIKMCRLSVNPETFDHSLMQANCPSILGIWHFPCEEMVPTIEFQIKNA